MSRSTIVPHASHTLSSVEGETHCTVCFAAPWMPIVEQPCQAYMTGMGDPTREHMTLEEMEHAIWLHDHDGMRWDQVASTIGCNANALRKAVARFAKGEGRLAAEKRKRDALLPAQQPPWYSSVMIGATVGDRIKRARERASMSQMELAKAVGGHQHHVSRWENGIRPRPSRVRQIAQALGVSVAWLATGEGEP